MGLIYMPIPQGKANLARARPDFAAVRRWGMPLSALPLGSSIDAYAAQADHLLDEWGNGESWAIEVFHRRHPQFLDEKIKWLPKRLSPDDIRAAAFHAPS